mmetsp:Transcript_89792/g.239917  ORF Transcript_89792/g.239917 Transcript_89792/m.239917 type:complete len:287 (-) Transcript_89792:220-1080(-)
MYPQNFYIGLDKKGSRLWAGICEAESKGLINVAFIRGDISLLESYFGPHELDEIWITFPEPQPGGETSRAKARNRVTSAEPGLARLHRILRGGGLLHLKTDSHLLYRYTLDQMRVASLIVDWCTDDLYGHINTEAVAAHLAVAEDGVGARTDGGATGDDCQDLSHNGRTPAMLEAGPAGVAPLPFSTAGPDEIAEELKKATLECANRTPRGPEIPSPAAGEVTRGDELTENEKKVLRVRTAYEAKWLAEGGHPRERAATPSPSGVVHCADGELAWRICYIRAHWPA